MCEDLEFEHGAIPDHCDTPESRAVWRRAEAFAISQPVAEKLADLVETLARMAMIMDAEVAASSSWARVELETWLNRVRGMPPTTSRAELKLLDAEALSFFLSDPKLHAAYDAASAWKPGRSLPLSLKYCESKPSNTGFRMTNVGTWPCSKNCERCLMRKSAMGAAACVRSIEDRTRRLFKQTLPL